MKQSLKNYKRVVIKIGSSLFCADKGRLDCGLLNEITSQIRDLVAEGIEVAVVSSGAIAMGMAILRLGSRPKDLAHLQACAAVGQPELMDAYQKFFKLKQLNCSQVLLTWEDFNDRKRYLNAKNTLLTLLSLGSVPVINENDTVSTDEIKFGDNDRLSALVSILIGAQLLVILSDVDGLLDKDKLPIRIVDEITPELESLACPTNKKTCVGGMITKLEAAKMCVGSGIPCIIADGRKKDIIKSCVTSRENSGTIFLPRTKCLAAKKQWIAFGVKPKGNITVDDGARLALVNKKSLLSVGVISCEGNFNKGDIVSLRDKSNCEFARGKSALSGKELDKIKGRRHDKEVIHCDDIVVTI